MSDLDLTDDDLQFAAIADNPELAAAAEKVLSGSSQEVGPAPTLSDPTDGPVTLTVGFRRTKVTASGTEFEEIRKAWVRELNGEDEEKIAKARLSGEPEDFIYAVLESGVERLGDERPTKEDFEALVLGDREYLLMEIARATYGDTLDYKEIVCPHCGEKFDVTLSISEEIPVTRLEKVTDQQFEVRLSKDRVAKASLPTVSMSRELVRMETAAEQNTLIISRCVSEITGPKGTVQIAGDETAARRLSIRDRQTLTDEMYERMPGPKYNGVRFNHEPGGCGKEVRLEVTMADLFRSL
jgi:hypothetical protein